MNTGLNLLQIEQYINEVNQIKRINEIEESKAKVEKACEIYDELKKMGYHYAGWAAGTVEV